MGKLEGFMAYDKVIGEVLEVIMGGAGINKSDGLGYGLGQGSRDS